MEYPYLSQSLQLSFVGFSQIISYLINAQKQLDTKERYTRLNPHQDLSELAYAPPDPEAHLTSQEFNSLIGKTPAEIFNVDALKANFASYLSDSSTPIPVMSNPGLYSIQVIDLRKLPVFQLILTTPKMGLNLLNSIFGFDKFDRNATVHPAVLNLLSTTVREELNQYLEKQVPNERAKTIAALDGLYRLTQLNLQVIAYGQAQLYDHALIIDPTVSLVSDWSYKLNHVINFAEQQEESYGMVNFGYFERDSRDFMSLDYLRDQLGLKIEEQLMFHFQEQKLLNIDKFDEQVFATWQEDPSKIGSSFMLMRGQLNETKPDGRGSTGYVLNLAALRKLGKKEVKMTPFTSINPTANVQKALQFSQANSKNQGEISGSSLKGDSQFNSAWEKLKVLLNWNMLEVMSPSFPLVAKVNANIFGINRPLLNYSQQIFIYTKKPHFYVSFYNVRQHRNLKSFLGATPSNITWYLRPLLTLNDYNLEYREDHFEDYYRNLSPELVELTLTVKDLFKRILENKRIKEDDYIFITNTHQQLPANVFQSVENFLTKGQAEPAFRTPLSIANSHLTHVNTYGSLAVASSETFETKTRLSRKKRQQLEAQQLNQTFNQKLEQALEALEKNSASKTSKKEPSQELKVEDFTHNEELSLLELIKQQDEKDKAHFKANLNTKVDNSLVRTANLGQIIEQSLDPQAIKKHITGIEAAVPLIVADGFTDLDLLDLVNKTQIPSWKNNRIVYPLVRTNTLLGVPNFSKVITQTNYQITTKVATGSDGKAQAAFIRMLNHTNVLTANEKEQLEHFLKVQVANNEKASVEFDKFAFVPADLWQALKASQKELIKNAYRAKQSIQFMDEEISKEDIYSLEDYEHFDSQKYFELAQELGMEHFITPMSSKVESYLAEIFKKTNRKYGPFPYQYIKDSKINHAEQERIQQVRNWAKENNYRVVGLGQRLYFASPDALEGVKLLFQFAKFYQIQKYKTLNEGLTDGAVVQEDLNYDNLAIWLDYKKVYTQPVMANIALVNRNLLAKCYHYDVTSPKDLNRMLKFMTDEGMRGDEMFFGGYNRYCPIGGLARPYVANLLVPVQSDPYIKYQEKAAALELLTQAPLTASNQEFQYLVACQQAIQPWSNKISFLANGYRYPTVQLPLFEQLQSKYRPRIDQANRTMVAQVRQYYLNHHQLRDDVILLDNVACVPQGRALTLQSGNDCLSHRKTPSTWIISKSLIRQSAPIWQESDWHLGKLYLLVSANQRIGFINQSGVEPLPLERIIDHGVVYDQQSNTPSIASLLNWGRENKFASQTVSQIQDNQQEYLEHISKAYEHTPKYPKPQKQVQVNVAEFNEGKFFLEDEEESGLSLTTGFRDEIFDEQENFHVVQTTSFYNEEDSEQTDQNSDANNKAQKAPQEKVTVEPPRKKGAWWKFGFFSDEEEPEPERNVDKSKHGTPVKAMSFDVNNRNVQVNSQSNKTKTFDDLNIGSDFQTSTKQIQTQAFAFTAGIKAKPEEIIAEAKPVFGGSTLIQRAQHYVARKLQQNEATIFAKGMATTTNFDLGVKVSPANDYAKYLKRVYRQLANEQGHDLKAVEQQMLGDLNNLVHSSAFAIYPSLEQQASDVGLITYNRNTPQTLSKLKIKVLNLDTQFYRWEKMLNQLEDSSVASIQRIDGIRGEELSAEVIKENFAQDKFIRYNHRFATPREIGIALAHRKALLSALYDESIDHNDFVLICEDDIIFSPEWQRRMARILLQASNEPIDAINLLHPKILSNLVSPLELHHARVLNLSSWHYVATPNLPQLVSSPSYQPLTSSCYLVRKSAIANAVQKGVLDQVGASASDLVNFLEIWPDRIRTAVPTLAHLNHEVNTMDSILHNVRKAGAIYNFGYRRIKWTNR
ncbi:hypothetical protein CKF54_00045 [Psittacicella hinzii]|uniref:Glycosyl transferase family 25 domain-containing protein n=1 Tax=Psittacicella hinzii TaxID=2028575 RepID=A0A3A1YBI8_9GAMM|nr:glycosyltransferase family 25 protein [Psittacicella hinzii]RIY34550.1 hypothetical protein CKF54_00045 [Psittacicella hinzii]